MAKNKLIEIGRTLYYDINTGDLLYDSGELWGEDIMDDGEAREKFAFENVTKLKEYDRKKVGVKKLKFGEYREEFARSRGIMIDPKTTEIKFNLVEAAAPPVTTEQLQAQVAELSNQIAELTKLIKASK